MTKKQRIAKFKSKILGYVKPGMTTYVARRWCPFVSPSDDMEPILALQRKVLGDMYAYKMPSIMIADGVVYTTWPPLTPVEQQLVTTLQDLVTACAHQVRARVRTGVL